MLLSILPAGLVRMIENIAGLSKVQVDPNRPVAGCRMQLDPKAPHPVQVQCKTDPERFPAAQAQGLQCRMEPKITLEPGKATVDFLVYCGPKTAERDARRAKAYFGGHGVKNPSIEHQQLRSEIPGSLGDFMQKRGL